ncbi:hypothetical protein HDU93_009589 [Gonapodya sp. JEL0774]|nr:hypothetical protein HDU93_009589 [Gonapodya sp. JEL0774]
MSDSANRAKSRYEEQYAQTGVPEWSKKYINYRHLSTLLSRVERAVRAVTFTDAPPRFTVSNVAPVDLDPDQASSHVDSDSGSTTMPFKVDALQAVEEGRVPLLQSNGSSAGHTHRQRSSGTEVDDEYVDDDETASLVVASQFTTTVGVVIPESLHDLWRRKRPARRESLVPGRSTATLTHRIKDVLDSRGIPEESEFLENLEREIDKVSTFFRSKEDEALRAWEDISAQLVALAKEAEEIKEAEATNGVSLAGGGAGVGAPVSTPSKGSTCNVDSPTAPPTSPAPTSTNHYLPSAHPTSSAVHRAVELLHSVARLPLSLAHFPDPLRGIAAHRVASYGSTGSTDSVLGVRDGEDSDLPRVDEMKRRHATVVRVVEQAVIEFYRSCRMLKSFQQLNKLGIGELLKRFNEVAGWNPAQFYNLETHHLFQSHELDHLLTQVAKVYSHRDRLRTKKHRDQELVGYRTGFYCGAAFMLTVAVIKHVLQEQEPEAGIEGMMMLIFGGFALPMVMLVFVAVNFVLFAHYRINYPFIFETNQRDHITALEFVEIIFVLVITWALFAYLAIAENLFDPWIPRSYYPTLLLAVDLAIVLNPFDTLYRSSRFWFVRTMGRIAASGWLFVEFRDFLLTDVLGSLTYTFTALAVFACGYSNGWDEDTPSKCDLSRTWCVRRYFDTHTFGPHIGNALKYLLAIITIVLSSATKLTGGQGMRIGWIGVAILSTVYATWWDIRMDHLGVDGNTIAFGLALLEVVRRGLWLALRYDPKASLYQRRRANVTRPPSLCRIENEHSYNIGHFRATKEVPLPPLPETQ